MSTPACVLESWSAEATIAAGRALAPHLEAGDVIGLIGDLGSGKTTLARGVIAGLGADDPAVSPTFILIREYRGRLPVFHLDLYRLDEERELLKIGVPDILAGDGVALVEWSPRLGSLRPEECLEIELTPGRDEDLRTIAFRPSGPAWRERLAALWPVFTAAARERSERAPKEQPAR